MPDIPPYSIVKAMQTMRAVSELSYYEALIKAVEFFQLKDWEIPDSILTLYHIHKGE